MPKLTNWENNVSQIADRDRNAEAEANKMRRNMQCELTVNPKKYRENWWV